MLVKFIPRSIRPVLRRSIALLLPEFREGNRYDPRANTGVVRIFISKRNECLVVWVCERILYLQRKPSIFQLLSRKKIRSLVPFDILPVVANVDPYLIHVFAWANRAEIRGIKDKFPSLHQALIPIDCQKNEEVVRLLLTKDFGGYFHFLLEILPILIKVNEQQNCAIYILKSLTEKYPFSTELFALFNLPYQITKEPILPSAQTTLSKLVPVSNVPYHYPNYASVVVLRRKALAMELNFVPPYQARLFIVRRRGTAAGRFLKDERQVMEALRPFGFESICCEDYSPKEQAARFAAARFIVGVQGAGLSNMVFMGSGSRVLELMPDTEIKWHMALLAQHCSHIYGCLVCQTVAVDGDRPAVVDVSTDVLVEKIKYVLSRPD